MSTIRRLYLTDYSHLYATVLISLYMQTVNNPITSNDPLSSEALTINLTCDKIELIKECREEINKFLFDMVGVFVNAITFGTWFSLIECKIEYG